MRLTKTICNEADSSNRAMTNEELAMMIQRGHTEYYKKLWEQTYKLINSLVKREALNRLLPNDIDLEDLLQCGYFAMVAAVKAFDVGKELKFTSYLGYHVKNCVAFELGRGGRNRKHLKEQSYNTPVGNDEGNTELVDLLEDTTAAAEFEQIELTDTQRIVREAIGELPELERDIIVLCELKRMSMPLAAAELNIELKNVRRIRAQAIRKLCRNRSLQALSKEYEAHWYYSGMDRAMWSVSPVYYAVLNEIYQRRQQGEYISYGKEMSIYHLARSRQPEPGKVKVILNNAKSR